MAVVTPTITSNGYRIDARYQLLYLEITREANRIPTAELAFEDGSAAKREFKISDTKKFEPGRKININLRYEGKSGSTVFEGIVIKHNIKSGSNGSVLTLELRDESFKMTYPRKSMVYKKLSDSKIIKKIVQKNNISIGTVSATKFTHEEIVQYYCSDWDFVLSRADVNGMLVFVDDGKLSLKKISMLGYPKHTIEYAIGSVHDFEMEVDAALQHDTVSSVAWDIKKQQVSKPQKAAKFNLSQGKTKGETIAQAIDVDPCELVSLVPMKSDEIGEWANAQMIKSRMSMIRGFIKVNGDASFKLGDIIKLEGIGDRFNGKTIVTGIRHEYTTSGWYTDIQFGLTGDWFSKNQDIVEKPASGLLPGINGLQIGIVQKLDDDPDFRIKVKIPAIKSNGSDSVVWARFASIYAGEKRGLLFRPEIGDEVVIGFLNDDPRQAIILGSMFSSKNKAPEKLSAANAQKGIFTKGGLEVNFDDQNKILDIKTSEKNYIKINEKTKKIQIVDGMNDNTFTLDSKGITASSKKDISFTSENFTIKANKKVSIKGSAVEIK